MPQSDVKQVSPPPARRAAIVVENVTKRYPARGFRRNRKGPERLALDRISLTVGEGETIGLLGPNGAGKTTLLKSIATLLEVTEGRILIHGHDVSRDPLRARRSMGLVTCDERSFYWRLTGRQNLEFFATLYGVRRAEVAPRIAGLLETLGLAEAADAPYHSYSTGMRQKMAIARGLLSAPRLILFDEPTRSLDPLSAHNIHAWIRQNQAAFPDTTRVVATNQLQEATRLCDRLLIINRGRLIASGTAEEITTRFRRREHVVHRIACRNYRLNGHLASSAAEGLIEVAEESADGDTTRLRVSAAEASDALTVVLDEIIRAGGRILCCETERVPFDEVFCAAVMEDGRQAARGGAR